MTNCRIILIIGLVGFVGCALVGLVSGLPIPHAMDEFSYLLAADTFASGRITNPTHPMWPHFGAGHVIHQPSYMSKYPPATGLFLAVGQLLGHPAIGVWLSFALMCTAIAWALKAWGFSPWWALLTVFNPVLGIIGYWAQSYWGGAVAALGGTLAIGAVRVRAGFIFGLGLAILANSRPFEGLILAIGLAALVIWKRGVGEHRFFLQAGVVLLPVALLMAIYNYRITGDPLKMPYQVYAERHDVAPKFIFQGLLKPEPEDISKDMDLRMYKTQRTVIGFILKNITFAGWWLAASFNVIFLLLCGLRWRYLNTWERGAALLYGFFFAGLTLEVPMMLHYWAPILCLNYLFVAKAAEIRPILLRWTLPLLIAAFPFSYYTQTESQSSWHTKRAQIMARLEILPGKHLVMVRYPADHPPHEEWVANRADIDGAKVVWARSMENDSDLIRYFRTRTVWKLDASAGELTE